MLVFAFTVSVAFDFPSCLETGVGAFEGNGGKAAEDSFAGVGFFVSDPKVDALGPGGGVLTLD